LFLKFALVVHVTRSESLLLWTAAAGEDRKDYNDGKLFHVIPRPLDVPLTQIIAQPPIY
jgi:hypothetical protein